MEQQYIDLLQKLVPTASGFLKTSLGHDGAWVGNAPDEGWYVSTDCQVEGVHYRPDWMTPRQRGRKLAFAGLSDLLATGCRPELAFLNLDLPMEIELSELEPFAGGIADVFRPFGVALAGGNLARSLGGWHAHLTVMGAPPEGGPWLRCTARPGDKVWLGGQAGLAGLGLADLLAGRQAPGDASGLLRFCDPWESLQDLYPLAPNLKVTAAMDLSDGLAQDLPRLLGPDLGLTLNLDQVLTGPFKASCSSRELQPVEVAMGGGEDYLPLLCLPPECAMGSPWVMLGVVEKQAGLRINLDNRTLEWNKSQGFDHFKKNCPGG